MALTTPKKTNRDNLNNAKHKLYIGYLYFKRYLLWIFLALFLLFVLNIIIKNVSRTNNQTPSQVNNTSIIKELVVKANKKVEPAKAEGRSQLASLKQQLSIEKAKNKTLEKTLNNQKLQITSALDEINQSFQNFNNKSPESNKISVLTGVSNNQTEYYNKVKAALSKINPRKNNKVETLSTTNDDNSQVNLTKKEG